MSNCIVLSVSAIGWTEPLSSPHCLHCPVCLWLQRELRFLLYLHRDTYSLVSLHIFRYLKFGLLSHLLFNFGLTLDFSMTFSCVKWDKSYTCSLCLFVPQRSNLLLLVCRYFAACLGSTSVALLNVWGKGLSVTSLQMAGVWKITRMLSEMLSFLSLSPH